MGQLTKFIPFALVLAVVISFCNCACPNGRIASGVSANERNLIVNKHNELRLRIARGSVPNQPRGVNLKRLRWDNNLAARAQAIANTCVYAHVDVNDNRWPVGQNIAEGNSRSVDNRGPSWNSVIETQWFDEYKLYRYPNGFALATGHYTQVVWADTQYIGCGYSYYKDARNTFRKLYVCNYGTAGNFNNRAPYLTRGSVNCPNLC